MRVIRSSGRVVLLCLAALSATACAANYNARTLGVPVRMAAGVGEAMPGDSFRVTTRSMHLMWGAVLARQPSLRQVLAGQLGTGAGVANLTIRSRKRWSDLLVTGLTLGLISTTSVTFEGVITPATP